MSAAQDNYALFLAAAACRLLQVKPYDERVRAALEMGESLSETEFVPFKTAFTAFKRAIDETGGINAAIDGRSGAGKSTLARAFNMVWGGNVFHIDDYFLPVETVVKKGTPNFDVLRFEAEAGAVLNNGKKGALRRFDCASQSLCPPVETEPSEVNVTEGAYSFYTESFIKYDLKIFMDTDAETQLNRIEMRVGKQNVKAFKQRWIPLENAYFERYSALERAHIVVRT